MRERSIKFALLLAATILAIHPLTWLWRTWHDTITLSTGGYIGLCVAVLFMWSVTSPRHTQARDNYPLALCLIGVSALTRLTGQLLGINVIGALTLVVDVYALALWCSLHSRRRALSGLWLAVLFALSLPIERILQRVVGYPLQEFAANLACHVLSLGKDLVSCNGIDINIAGQQVLVDLPCAGTSALHSVMVLFSVVAALKRPTLTWAGCGLIACIFAALIGNVVRIVLLAIGIAYPEHFGGIDVMTAPWHEGIGLIAFVIPLTVVVIWSRLLTTTYCGRGAFKRTQSLTLKLNDVDWIKRFVRWLAKWRVAVSIGAVSLAAVIVNLPAQPIDVSKATNPIRLPNWLHGHTQQALSLSPLERQYFAQYGGAVARAAYGQHVLLVVKTSSPLRHIHSPEDCLRGIGHRVRYQGQTRGQLPSAIYRSTDPHGHEWHISVSYVSEHNQRVTSIGHAAWLWLQQPTTTWTMIQRIAPWQTNRNSIQRFDSAVARALETTYLNHDHTHSSAPQLAIDKTVPVEQNPAGALLLDHPLSQARSTTLQFTSS